ncbi:MAG: tetratricopeptide repeat protein [Phycisphaerales bacterium]
MVHAGEQAATECGGAAALRGQRVAFTGRFATLTRAEAEKRIGDAGGGLAPSVSPRTTMLVVGMRGWPLMDSGRITGKLAQAEQLRAGGHAIRIVSETEFRELLGLDPAPEGVSKSLTPRQVCGALGVDQKTLERWERCGLVRSSQGRYDFRDLVSLRTVTNLVARGVSPVVIRKSLDALSRLLPGVERPLAQLNILVSDSGELVAEVEEALLTQSGQLEMRFGTSPGSTIEPKPLSLVRADNRDSAAWIELGLGHELSGNLAEAEHAYRRAAALAPSDASPQFNLGNTLLAGGRLEAAAERYAQAVALDPGHAASWFNLAHVQDALGDRQSAIRYLRRAISADPAYADAHYNLADAAERAGDRLTAEAAWDEYLRLDPASPWAREARRRLQALRGPKWA